MTNITCENIEQYSDIIYEVYSHQFEREWQPKTDAVKRLLGMILPFLSYNQQSSKTHLDTKVMIGKHVDIVVIRDKEEFWINLYLLSRLWFKYKARLSDNDKQRYYRSLISLHNCQGIDSNIRYKDFTLEERCDILATYHGCALSLTYGYKAYYTDTEAYYDTPIGIVKLKFKANDLMKDGLAIVRNGDLIIVYESSLMWATVIRDNKILTQISDTTQVTGIVPSDDKATRRKMLFCECERFSYSDMT